MAKLQAPQQGFTLIELLVAISLMAVMAVMGWRALDGMQQSISQSRAHTDAVLTLEAGLGQWGTDLDALAEHPSATALDWNGKVLRITRRHSADPSAGVLVVAWTLDRRNEVMQWLRWQSAPVRNQQDWQRAWNAAAQWAQSPGAEARLQETAITPVTEWTIYFHRGGTWSNPLSSTDATETTQQQPSVPDGVRLMLTIPNDHPLRGPLLRDWVRPTLGAVTQ
jgi:general secretion pathway protein J